MDPTFWLISSDFFLRGEFLKSFHVSYFTAHCSIFNFRVQKNIFLKIRFLKLPIYYDSGLEFFKLKIITFEIFVQKIEI